MSALFTVSTLGHDVADAITVGCETERTSAATLSPSSRRRCACCRRCGDLGSLEIVAGAGDAGPGAEALLDLGIGPVADDHLPAEAQAEWRNPASRSPWAAWLRFMKSMSIVLHGRSRLNCGMEMTERFVQRGESADPHLGRREVCIQSTRPAQLASALASRQTWAISSGWSGAP